MKSDHFEELPWIFAANDAKIEPSRLLSTPPVGIGTYAVESLSSYVSRKADAYHLTVADFLRAEISPLLKHTYLDPGKMTYKSFKAAAAMDGRCNTGNRQPDTICPPSDFSSMLTCS